MKTVNSQSMILVKGQPATRDIQSIEKDSKGVYWILYRNGKKFPYSDRDVCFLTNPVELNTDNIRLSSERQELFNIKRIWGFQRYLKKYYRIEFLNGKISEYKEEQLSVSKSALEDNDSKRIFKYFTEVSKINKIITEDGIISLSDYYDKLTFIDENTVLGCYLNPSLMRRRSNGYKHLLFPFYSNLSQMKAVDNALKSQVSIIQGPPGTGKTQTILNIIANIVSKGKTVLVVSSNNSAVENIKEKLDKEGLGFIVAELSKSENKKDFINHGQVPYPNMIYWQQTNIKDTLRILDNVSKELLEIFESQNKLAEDRQELSDIEIEGKHFCEENKYDKNRLDYIGDVSSDELVRLWVKIDIKREEKEEDGDIFSLWRRIKNFFKNLLLGIGLKKIFGKDIKDKSDEDILLKIKAAFYSVRKDELQSEINDLEAYLKDKHADELLRKQARISMKLFKALLYVKYMGGINERPKFDKDDFWKNSDTVSSEYPVVLSTTFSAMSTLPGHTFDYLIMDEASQVPVESAVLALSKARNAVIVGDLKQLPNIVTEDNNLKIRVIGRSYKIDKRYDCVDNSFLSSVIKVLPNAPQTLLREHYRCAPMIINFCNQKFYGGKLVIITKAGENKIPMKVIRTVKGNHSRSVNNGDKVYVFNQREVDEFKKLLEAKADESLSDVGIITPYKGQAMLFHKEFGSRGLEADTIHKYQGREKDTIVMSTVADTYNDFVDNDNLINVAVSRAKKEFVLITNGNDNPDSNIKELIDYINYNHGKVENSNLHSIFDLLYSSYAEQRKEYLEGKGSVSDFDSENIAFNVIKSILRKNDDMSCLEVIPHYHLSSLINDTSLLAEEEYKLVRSSWSHVDFLIENRVSKQPVLVIEVDGFAYHHKGTKLAERDKLKDSVLNKYHIPLLRLSTTGVSVSTFASTHKK